MKLKENTNYSLNQYENLERVGDARANENFIWYNE